MLILVYIVNRYKREWLQVNFKAWFTSMADSAYLRWPRSQIHKAIGQVESYWTSSNTRYNYWPYCYHLRSLSKAYPQCGCGSERDETVVYLLCVCPAHAYHRRRWLGNPCPSHESVCRPLFSENLWEVKNFIKGSFDQSTVSTYTL